tara:strand:- start:2126 stop:3103 length:978 start_codon:yes stop_codon:yes gene_type:complete
MKIAIEKYPFIFNEKIGPYIFLERISKQFKNKGINLTNKFDPFYDFAIFANTNKSIYKKPYFLRIGGIFFDKKNTAINTIEANKKIFESIDNSIGTIFISEFTKNLVKKFHKNLKVPNVVINNSVSLNLFSSKGNNLREKLKLKSNDFVIITSAAWRRHKRLNEIIKLFYKLKTEINNLKLIILGEYDLKKTDQDIILAGNIKHFKLPEWYRTANVYVHLSWIDQNPNTLVEAIACGLPSLCTNNGGTHELITRTNSGIVSNADKNYDYKLIDYYNPPEPKYELLINDFMKIYNNYEEFKKSINTDPIDINSAAVKYLNFFQKNT